MKKFKLIKKYPSLSEKIKVGDLVYFTGALYETVNKYLKPNCDEYYSLPICRRDVENYPEFWMEVKSNNNEIRIINYEQLDQSVKNFIQENRYEYFIGLRDQEIYLKAVRKLFPNKEERRILDKYKYIGCPIIYLDTDKLIKVISSIYLLGEYMPFEKYIRMLNINQTRLVFKILE